MYLKLTSVVAQKMINHRSKSISCLEYESSFMHYRVRFRSRRVYVSKAALLTDSFIKLCGIHRKLVYVHWMWTGRSHKVNFTKSSLLCRPVNPEVVLHYRSKEINSVQWKLNVELETEEKRPIHAVCVH